MVFAGKAFKEAAFVFPNPSFDVVRRADVERTASAGDDVDPVFTVHGERLADPRCTACG